MNKLEFTNPIIISLPSLPLWLERLDCKGCTNLESLPELPPLLKELVLHDCTNLKSLPELPASLTHLYCLDCTSLISLPSLPISFNLLCCKNCPSLKNLPILPYKNIFFSSSLYPLSHIQINRLNYPHNYKKIICLMIINRSIVYHRLFHPILFKIIKNKIE